MPKTGTDTELGTAEGAIRSRAAHSLHAQSPVLDDYWAIELLAPESQEEIRDPAHYREHYAPNVSKMAPIEAIGIGSLRYAEDAVSACIEAGMSQYAILGAGFDTFALRRADLAQSVSVYEVDFPDVQALKRDRVSTAAISPAIEAEYVPIDFESTLVSAALEDSSFDAHVRSVFSWMNTTQYLTEQAVRSTLLDIAEFAAAGSRLVLNYAARVPLTDEQMARIQGLAETVAAVGEPLNLKSWAPEDFESLVRECGFTIVEHATERDLVQRFFSSRADGFAPGLPVRLILAEIDRS